jgi:ankyrin repeat protein
MQQIVFLLYSMGADISCTNEHGNTPLHVAAQHERMDVIQELLLRGADDTSVLNCANQRPSEMTNNHAIVSLLQAV